MKSINKILIGVSLVLIMAFLFVIKSHFEFMPSIFSITHKPFNAIFKVFDAKNQYTEYDSDVYIYSPGITRYYEDSSGELITAKPDPIAFSFNLSAANINLIGSEVDNINMSPKAEGKWKWENEYTLVFTPVNDWPAGEEYRIKLPKDIFNNEIKVKNYYYTVTTPAFEASLVDFNLYQDPKNPRNHQLQASFSFSHSVDIKTFEKSISLEVNKKKVDFTVTYDKLQRNAFVTSVPVQITTKDQTAVVELDSVKAVSKGKGSDKIKNTISIPSQEKFFKISGIESIIVRNEQEDPEQFIAITFSDGVDAKELSGKVEAYLLPFLHPTKKEKMHPVELAPYADGHYDTNGNWIEPARTGNLNSYRWKFAEVTPEILKLSQKINLTLAEDANDIRNVFMYRYNIPDLAERYIYVKVNEGIKSQIDFVIKAPYEKIMISAAYPKELNILQAGSILPLGGSKRLTFKSRGITGIKVELARVSASQINHLITQTYGNFENPAFKNNYDFNQNNISQKFTKNISLNMSLSKANYSSVDMNEFLKAGGSGLFFVKAQGYTNNSNNGPMDNRFILVTDLGILVKKDRTNKHHVFVVSITNGRPVANAKVELLAKNGTALLTQYTNEQGCAVFNKVQGYNYEKEPVAYIATNGSDISFLPYNRYDREVNYSKFNIGGQYYSSKAKGLQAFVFSDRGIYRPGDSINFGAILKNEDWSNTSGIPVKFVLKDPYNKTVFEKTVTLNSSGFLTIDEIKTFSTSPTGTYYAYVYLVKNDKNSSMLGSTSIRVEEFRTDSIKVNAKITGTLGTGWALPENLKGFVTANNMFATPAQNRTVQGAYILFPAEFKFSKYANFTFPDPYKIDNKNAITSVSENFKNTITNENGEAEFTFDLSKYSGGTYNLTFSAEVAEGDSGKTVANYNTIKVSPYKYLLGYKTSSKLSYLNKGSAANIDLIVVDNNLKTIELKNLKLKIMRRQYISSLVKQNNGVYKYQSVVKDSLFKESALNIATAGSKITLDTQNPGNYIAIIENTSGSKVLSFEYFVAGASNQTFAIEKDANLMVNLQNDDVSQGTQLTLNITAPYTGTGLITIEKDKVYAYKWFKTTTNSSVQTITVPNTVEGDAYVNVSFIRSIDSKEIFSSPHSYAVVPFKISLAKRKVAIDLKTPEVVKPGEEIEILYKASQNSKIVVYAVDQGVLQVANYTTPNPLGFFFRKSALEVMTFQTVDLILPDYKIIQEISGIGGGFADSEAKLSKNLNPFTRKQIDPVVFWSKTLDATTEYKKVKYKIPAHFNGLLKIMAVAATQDKAGSAEKEVIVKSPVIISPVAPLAALPGDTFEVSATISNLIEGSKSASLEVWLETNDKFAIEGTNKQTLEIKEGSEKTVRFNLKTLDILGSGDLVFKAKAKNDVYKSEVSVSVRPANVYQTRIKAGISDKSKTKVDGFTRDMYKEFATREIAVSYSPQIVFLSIKKYFNAYPHGCTEQIISSAFPFIYSAASERKGFITPKEQQELFKNALDKVRVRQENSGGFPLWPDSSSIHPYATIYTLHFFTDAKELGYGVPGEILTRGQKWLKYYASELPKSFEDARLKAYANYILTRNNVVTTRNLIRIEEYLNEHHKNWKEDITSAYIASCYKMLQDSKKANSLIKEFKADAKDKFVFYSDYDSSSLRNATYLYLCNKHFKDNLNTDAQAIADGLVKVIMDGKYNTISSSYILLALLSYGNSLSANDFELKVFAKNNDTKESELTLNADPFPFTNFNADIKEFNIVSTGKAAKVYYTVIQQGFDKVLKDFSEGIDITRDYLDSNGSVIKTAQTGDIVTVRIRVKTKSREGASLAVIDLLPACFEIISGSQTGYFDSMDTREDRMIFYPYVSNNITELTYKVKVVTKGNFTVPGVYAAGMYDPNISALAKQSKIEITHPQ